MSLFKIQLLSYCFSCCIHCQTRKGAPSRPLWWWEYRCYFRGVVSYFGVCSRLEWMEWGRDADAACWEFQETCSHWMESVKFGWQEVPKTGCGYIVLLSWSIQPDHGCSRIPPFGTTGGWIGISSHPKAWKILPESIWSWRNVGGDMKHPALRSAAGRV